MPYKPSPHPGFGGGLNLRDSEDVVDANQAIDTINTIFTNRGAAETRSGYNKFTQLEGTNRYDSLTEFYKSDGTRQIVAGAGNRLEAINTSGLVTGTPVATTANPHYFQRFGGPTGEHLYCSNGTDALRRWDGAAFTTPAYSGVSPTGRFVGLSITDNRLVTARFTGATAGNNPSTVRFSMEGDPLTWQTEHYVDLTPGDGEEIMGIASWRDQVIVFKQTKFFVFYGNSVNDEGEPEFNVRPVDAGVGMASPGCLTISEQGIYFVDRTGIYFTTGQQPSRVSDIVEGVFNGQTTVYYTGGTLNDAAIAQAEIIYHDERLFFSFPAGVSATNNRQLVFDPHEKWWSLFDVPMGPMTNFRVGDVEELVFAYASGTKDLGRYVEGLYTKDNMGRRESNLIENPRCETNYTDGQDYSVAGGVWFTNAGGVLNGPFNGAPTYDDYGHCVLDNAAINFEGVDMLVPGTWVAGTTYTFSLALSNEAGAAALQIFLGYPSADSNVIAVTPAPWTRHSISWTPLTTVTGNVTLGFRNHNGIGVSQTIAFSGWRLTAGTSTEFFDGDVGGGTWTGAANASSSYRFTSGVDGTDIASTWRSGWYDLGTQAVKKVREFKIAGSGTVNLGMSRDYRQLSSWTVAKQLSAAVAQYDSGVDYDSGAQYGPAGSVATKLIRRSIRGERFSIILSNSSGNAFKVNRLTHHVDSVRIPTIVKGP